MTTAPTLPRPSDAFEVATLSSTRTVHGLGTAFMVRNWLRATGSEPVISPTERITWTLATEAKVDALDSQFALSDPIEPEPVEEFPVDSLSLDVDFEQAEFPDDRDGRRYELEGTSAKDLRPIASALGVKGARVMAKPEMINQILAIEFEA